MPSEDLCYQIVSDFKEPNKNCRAKSYGNRQRLGQYQIDINFRMANE